MSKRTVVVFSLAIMLLGCANDTPLGTSVAKLRHEQTYDLNATLANKDVVPSGTGARMQPAYDDYTGQSAYDGRAETVMGRPLAVRN